MGSTNNINLYPSLGWHETVCESTRGRGHSSLQQWNQGQVTNAASRSLPFLVSVLAIISFQPQWDALHLCFHHLVAIYSQNKT